MNSAISSGGSWMSAPSTIAQSPAVRRSPAVIAWCEPKLRESWTTVTGTPSGASAMTRSPVPSDEPSSTSTSSKSYDGMHPPRSTIRSSTAGTFSTSLRAGMTIETSRRDPSTHGWFRHRRSFFSAPIGRRPAAGHPDRPSPVCSRRTVRAAGTQGVLVDGARSPVVDDDRERVAPGAGRVQTLRMPAALRSWSMREYHASPTERPSISSTTPAISSKAITGSPARRLPTAVGWRGGDGRPGIDLELASGPAPPIRMEASDQAAVRYGCSSSPSAPAAVATSTAHAVAEIARVRASGTRPAHVQPRP